MIPAVLCAPVCVVCLYCTCIKEFMEGSPHLFDFEGEMAQYASLEEEIQELPELRQLGAILLSVGG